jgi:ABC-2 type transport system permease protein
MERFKTLMLREWLQHRLGWTLLAGIPLGLSLLLVLLGQIQISEEEALIAGDQLALMITLVSMVSAAAGLFVILWLTGLLLMSNLARRDHGDRSHEFWLSMPVGHVPSLSAPLLTHLVVVPAVALLIGLLGGWVISLVAVARIVELGAWFALPWGQVLAASLAVTLRLLAGMPLAVLWMAPLLLAVMLAMAWFRRWGIVLLAVGLGLGGWVLKRLLGQPLVFDFIGELLQGAGRALIHGGQASALYFERAVEGGGLELEGGMRIERSADVVEALRVVPGWAWHDFVGSVGALASPVFVIGLLISAGLFAALIDWRRRSLS